MARTFNEFRTFMRREGSSTCKLPAIFACASFLATSHAAEYFIAPAGSDVNPGTQAQPFGSLQHAQDTVLPGDTVWIRGGAYVFNDPITQGSRYLSEGEPDPGPGLNNIGVLFTSSGTASQPIRYQAYPGETPVFDFFAYQPVARIRGFSVQADYLQFKGIEIRGVQQIVTTVNESWAVRVEGPNNPSHNTFERLVLHHNEGPGLFIVSGGDNLVLNCDSHDNYDPDRSGENSDGFGCHSPGEGNRFIGNRAWNNSDDGYDCINCPGQVLFENNWAWRNGWIPGTNTASGNGGGFKAGGFRGNLPSPIPQHTLIGCVSWNNRVWGFNANGHQGPLKFVNNTSFGNARGFDFFDRTDVAHYARNNISHGNTANVFRIVDAIVDDESNTWNPGLTAADGDFLSLATVGMDGPRGPDGEMPTVNFMRLAPTSPLVDAGQNVGRPYHGAAPDLGAFESRVAILPGIHVIHTATANTASGNASSITIPDFQIGDGNALVVVVNSECSTVSYSVTYQMDSQPAISLTDGVFDSEGSQGAGVYWLISPSISGTTGDVVVTLGGNSSAAVSVLSLRQVLGVSDNATAKSTNNANLTLAYDGVVDGLVVAGGVDNAFSGATPAWSGTNVDTPLQALATNFSGGSAGIAHAFGEIETGGTGLSETFNPAGTGSSTRNAAVLVAFTTSVAANYANWSHAFDWGSADSSPIADPNSDGVSNLLCYYLDLHPLQSFNPDLLPKTRVDHSTSGGPWFVFEMRENTHANDVSAVIETCSNLESEEWSSLVPDGVNVISEIANPDPDGDGSSVLRRIRVKISAERCFLRLRVQLSGTP